MQNAKCKTQNYGTGFTIFEMTVAVTVFLVVMTVALMAFLNAGNIQKKAESLRAVNDNLNFAIEMILREIRTGNNYNKISDSEFSFTDAYNCTVTYSLSDNRIKRAESGAGICDNVSATPITAQEIKIDNLKFTVRGVGADSQQPLVIINIYGTAGKQEASQLKLNLQVTVSQRIVDS